MTEKKRWFWWAGFGGDVETEGMYSLGEFETREEAVAAGLAELPDGDGNWFFHVVEAQFADQLAGGDRDPDEFQPFGAERNKAIVEHPDHAGEVAK